MVVRNMCFPVNAAHTSIGINDCHGIEHLSVIPGFIKAHRNHRFQLFGQFFHMDDSIIFLWRSCISIIFIPSLLTEIRSFEKFRRKNDLRPLCSGLPDQFRCFFYIFFYIAAAAHLYGSHCGFSHIMLLPSSRNQPVSAV